MTSASVTTGSSGPGGSADSGGPAGPTRFEVTHTTEYSYPSTVSSSFGELVIQPRDAPGQRCLRSSLSIEPKPHDLRERVDFFGNRTTYFAVLAPHTRLSVTAVSRIDVGERPMEKGPEQPIAWRAARDRIRGAIGTGPDADEAALEARQYVLGSPLVSLSGELSGRLADYAATSFRPGAPLLEASVSLSSRIFHDFTYLPGATEVTSTIDEVLEQGAGVCQDFAHLAIGCLRSLGLAARYVSGYLETQPPPGQERLAGADASHAWFSVFVPGTGWVDVDPTNDQLVDHRYITTAWGRDYTDVPPVKGVIFTRGDRQDLRVAVDVLRVVDPEPTPDREHSNDQERTPDREPPVRGLPVSNPAHTDTESEPA
jgi:transglutaminase-like putative cysteine protease